jgi:hypothetical protein
MACTANCTVFVTVPKSPASLSAFALSQVYLLLGMCTLSVVITKTLKFWRDDPRLHFYYGAKHRLRRNMVSYVLELLVTTVIFRVFAIVGFPLLSVDPTTPLAPHSESIDVVVFFGLWLVALYLWELVSA